MKCLELKPKRSIINTDHRFIAQVPLMPNRYLWERQGANLALMASDKRDTLLVITDNEDFLKRYRAYYGERFEIAEHDDSFSVDVDFETIFGQVSFDAEVEVAEDAEADGQDSTED